MNSSVSVPLLKSPTVSPVPVPMTKFVSPEVELEGVGPFVAEHQVVALVAEDRVVALATVERVVAESRRR